MKVGLRKSGWAIETADSGDDALALCREQPFDVVVSDERMPGMQGSDLLTIIKLKYPDTLRVTLSGQASLERVVHSINAAEVHRFLLKPCPPSEVKATIEELLAKQEELESRARSTENLKSLTVPDIVSTFEDAMDRLWMSFQPVFARSGEVFGYEALVRTESTEVKGPDQFFDIATLLGRSQELGARIRDQVALEIPSAPQNAKILVNVNPDHLDDASLYLDSSPLARHADRVIIEITERSSLSAAENLLGSLERLAEMGYVIAVDDLGAGYSGLNTFSLLSPSVVKFDMELIRNVDRSPTKQAVIRAMTSLCSALGIRSVAEGIETSEEFQTAKELGCDLFQGFLLGRPQRGFVDGAVRSAA
ncbi:Oxygen sensor protein DosP [Planctomycetes bacterium Poly30]|uniref:Oxygen sensor protein DosP n=2 Tax=Saltatorellus ferox TaxID=2528018 RepID=A0A518EZG4_9BACT|nr:Oxygen sensor protein DosP [Planctomycetes bacterium Poly30]